MDFINKIDGASAWMRQGGVYRQADLYRRGEVLFARQGGGYVRLGISGATSHPKTTWLEIDAAGAPVVIRDGVAPLYQPSSPVAVPQPRARS